MTAMAILLGDPVRRADARSPSQYGLRPTEAGGASIVALAAQAAFGEGSALFVTFAASTALILFLAANTSFNAFPRLAAILAEDGYMPRQFSFRGDRLAYSWGIVLLAAIAFGLLWAFGGDTHALIPLYSVGVFVCFTLSQIGMVRHWLRERESGWRWRATVNAAGGRPDRGRPRGRRLREVRRRAPTWSSSSSRLLVAMMLFIHRQYARSAARAGGRARPRRARAAPRGAGGRPDPGPQPGGRPGHQRRRARSATTSGRSTSPTTPSDAAALRADFERQIPGVPLVVVESPYRALVGPLLAYLDVLDAAWPPDKHGADHVRRHPRVRGPALVGADPLQPGGEAAADGPARAAAHGRRERPVPARGPGALRGGARVASASAGPSRRPDADPAGDRRRDRRGLAPPSLTADRVPVVS